MGQRLLWICLTCVLWGVLRREEEHLRQAGHRRRWLALAALRGGLLGLAVALFLATGLTLSAGTAGRTPYFFDTFAIGLSMIGVPFGFLASFLARLKTP